MAERVVEVRLSAQVQDWIKGMEDAADAAAKVEAEGRKVAERNKAYQEIGRTAVVIGGSMTALSLAVMKTGIEYNSLQQKSRAAMTTMLGSAEKANEQMDRLDEFARTSPFSKAVFISAQQQMIAFGIEAQKVVPYLEAIQDAVAAAGGGNEDIAALAEIFGKISSTSKITATDLMQFGNRGIDAAQLIGSAMNKTAGEIRADITAGTLDAGAALDALAGGMQTKFAGAAANVKMTFEGATDRVRAAWRDVSADLMKPLVDPNGGGALIDFLNWTADIMRAFQALPEPVKMTTAAVFGLTGMVLLLGGAALLAWPKVMALKGALETVGVSMKTVGWAGGGAMLALTLLATAVGVVAGQQAAARQKAQSYADALKQGEDAARDLVAANLAVGDSFLWMNMGSAFDDAEKLGLGLDLVTDAARNGGAALAELDEKLQVGIIAQGPEAEAMAERLGLSLVELRHHSERLSNKVHEEADALDRGRSSMAQVHEATTGATGATGELERTADDAAKALDTMSDALKNVGREAWNVGEASDKAQGAINKLSDAAKAEGVSFYGLDDASIKLRDSTRQVEQSHRDSADAIIRNGGALSDATAEWQRGRDAVIDQMEAMGVGRAEATKWADDNLGASSKVKAGLKDLRDELNRMPDRKMIAIEANTTLAANGIDRLIQTYNGRTIRLDVATDSIHKPTGARPNFAGNLYDRGVQQFYQGGFASGIYNGVQGGIHKFAESEMGVPWETYISGRSQDRERNIGIWQETGRRLGATDTGQSVSLEGLAISGTLAIGGDGLGRIIDGRIIKSKDADARRFGQGGF